MRNLRNRFCLFLGGLVMTGTSGIGLWNFLNPSPPTITYYWVNAATGNDSNSGLSSTSAWKTLSYLSSQINSGAIEPCSTVYATGYFADQLSQINPTAVTSATTTPYQLPSSGNANCQLTIQGTGSFIIDGADLEPTSGWTEVGSTPVWQKTVSTHPWKMFVNDNNTEIPQTMPQTNARGQWSSTASYNEYDLALNTVVSNATVTGGNAMVIGQYPLTISGGGAISAAYGVLNVTSATSASVVIQGGGGEYTSPPIITATTGGTPPTITPVMYTKQYMVSPGVHNLVGTNPVNAYPYIELDNNWPNNGSYAVSNTLSGLQNVTATPNSWYVTPSGANWTVYAQMPGGDTPANYAIKFSHRAQNILLSSVDYVTVNNVQIEHAYQQCYLNIAALRSDLGGSYWTAEFNNINHYSAFNCGNVGTSATVIDPSEPTRFNTLQGDIVNRPGGETNPHFLRYIQPLHSFGYAGTVDDFPFVRGSQDAAFIDSGIDGGGILGAYLGLFAADSWFDTWHSATTQGYIYYPAGLSLTLGQGNHGGRIAYGTAYGCSECLDTGTDAAMRIDHNFIHDHYGEGIQNGGSAVSNALAPYIIDHNVIAQGGISPTGVGYNGIDSNGSTPFGFVSWQINNTIANEADACITFEGGEPASHVWNMICSMNAMPAMVNPLWSATGNAFGGYNGSSTVFWVGAGVQGVVATGGSGMTPGSYPLVFTGGGGTATGISTAATATATVASDGATVTVAMTNNGGFDYTSLPAVSWGVSPGGIPSILTPTLTGVSSRTQVAWVANAYDLHCDPAHIFLGCGGPKFNGRATTATFAAYWPQTGVLFGEDHGSQFVNFVGGATTSNDFRLIPGSVYIGAGTTQCILSVCGTADLGAIPYGTAFPFTPFAYVPPGSTPIYYQLVMLDSSRFVLPRSYRW